MPTIADQLAAFLGNGTPRASARLRVKPAAAYMAVQTIICPECQGNGHWRGSEETAVSCDVCRTGVDVPGQFGPGTVKLMSGGRTALHSSGALIAVLEGEARDLLPSMVAQWNSSRPYPCVALTAIPKGAPSAALAAAWQARGMNSEPHRSRGYRPFALYVARDVEPTAARRHRDLLLDAASSGFVERRDGSRLEVAELPAIMLTSEQLQAVESASEPGVISAREDYLRSA
jgi:hypothetical protein